MGSNTASLCSLLIGTQMLMIYSNWTIAGEQDVQSSVKGVTMYRSVGFFRGVESINRFFLTLNFGQYFITVIAAVYDVVN